MRAVHSNFRRHASREGLLSVHSCGAAPKTTVPDCPRRRRWADKPQGELAKGRAGGLFGFLWDTGLGNFGFLRILGRGASGACWACCKQLQDPAGSHSGRVRTTRASVCTRAEHWCTLLLDSRRADG